MIWAAVAALTGLAVVLVMTEPANYHDAEDLAAAGWSQSSVTLLSWTDRHRRRLRSVRGDGHLHRPPSLPRRRASSRSVGPDDASAPPSEIDPRVP